MGRISKNEQGTLSVRYFNPFGLIREDSRDPGHCREYARAELCGYLDAQGYSVERFLSGAYLDYRYVRPDHDHLECQDHRAVFNWIYRMMPTSLQPGVTVVARVPGTTADR